MMADKSKKKQNDLLALPDDIQPPQQLKDKPTTGRPTVYSKQLAHDILFDIATSSDPLDKIAKKHSITSVTFWRWTLINEQFCNAYIRALENRTLVESDGADAEIAKLLDYINNHDDDPREKHVRTGGIRLKLEHMRWKLSKYNRQLFGDKLEVDQHLTVEPAQERADAWALAQQAQDTDYKEVDNVDNSLTQASGSN